MRTCVQSHCDCCCDNLKYDQINERAEYEKPHVAPIFLENTVELKKNLFQDDTLLKIYYNHECKCLKLQDCCRFEQI